MIYSWAYRYMSRFHTSLGVTGGNENDFQYHQKNSFFHGFCVQTFLNGV